MVRTDRARAEEFFRVHHLAAKAAATTDDDMLDVVAEVLPWETTVGTMSLAQFSALDRVVTYVDSVDAYQQVAAIARAEDIPVLNAGYAYDQALAAPLGATARPGLDSRRLAPEELADRFTAPSEADERAFEPLLDVARSVLARSGSVPVARSFRPVLAPGRPPRRPRRPPRARPARRRGRARRSVGRRPRDPRRPVGRAALRPQRREPRACGASSRAPTPASSRSPLEALYAHALLSGRHPLTPFDSALVARALPALIDRAIEAGPS